jgi:hypothetical protein
MDNAIAKGPTEVGALNDILKNNFTPELKPIGKVGGQDRLALLAPKGMDLISIKSLLDEYAPQPARRRGIVKVQDLDSFIAIANRFKDEHSALFGLATLKPLKASLSAVFNYNRSGGDQATDADGNGVARHGDHRAVYEFPFSDQWVAWIERNGVEMKQQDFAAFIEDRIADVEMPPTMLANGTPTIRASGGDFGDRTPEEQLAYLANLLGGEFATPNRLVELSRGLTVHEQSRVKNIVNLNSGESQIQWETEHTDGEGQPIKVPNLFLITIPLFVNSWVYRIAVRLRYRKAGGTLVWYYQLYRHDLTFQKAFEEHAGKARDDIGLPLYLGTPE